MTISHRWLIMMLSCIALSELCAQPDFVPVDSILVSGYAVTADAFGHVYVSTDDHQLIKYSTVGEELFRYSNNFRGRIGDVNVANPLKVSVYYPDLRTLVILDRTLNELSTIELPLLGYPMVAAATLANTGDYWIYDEQLFCLHKISPHGDILLSSNNLAISLSEPLIVQYIREYNNRIILQTQQHGLLVFNLSGALVQRIPYLQDLNPSIPVSLCSNSVFAFSDRGTYAWSSSALDWEKVSEGFQSSPIRAAYLADDGILWSLSAGALYRYKPTP